MSREGEALVALGLLDFAGAQPESKLGRYALEALAEPVRKPAPPTTRRRRKHKRE